MKKQKTLHKIREFLDMKIVRTILKLILFSLFVVLLWMTPKKAVAQNYDYGSVEAYINDHKQQRSLLMARATIEYGNAALHELSSESADDYKEVNIDLDKYTRAFDIIDIIYQSARAAVNVYHTYDDVKETIVGYKELLDSFNEKIIQRGKIETADTLLIAINRKAIQDIGQEGEYLYKSVYDLVLYATGVAACTTADLLVLMENINTSLERLRSLIRNAYLSTWRYVQLRIGFWKGKIYNSKTKEQLLDEAFGRWREVGRRVLGY